MIRCASFLTCFALLCLMDMGGTALAHEARPAYLQLTESSPDTFNMAWKVPARGRFTRLEVGLVLPEGAQPVTPPVSRFIEDAVVEQSVLNIPGGLHGKTIMVDGLADASADALIRISLLDGRVYSHRLTPASGLYVVPEQPSRFDLAQSYAWLGVLHIWKGIDHLLFVLCLLWVAGRGRRLVAAITGFTVAHSLTLALSTLDLVHVPIPPVEAVIALSIVFLATEIARGNKQSLAYRKPILVSSCFGLLHGFGFAAVLQAIGLPQSDVPLALLFFNLGVEFGQLVFIGAVIGLTMVGLRLAPVFSREKVSFALQRAAVYGIGILASYWMIERIAGFV